MVVPLCRVSGENELKVKVAMLGALHALEEVYQARMS